MSTKIEWTGETWNPVTGCTKISTGCRNCYAERMAKRLTGRFGYPEQPSHFNVTVHGDKLDQPHHWIKPRMVFVCSMGDLFHEDVPFEVVHQVLAMCLYTDRHTFQILTKRPERMADILETVFFRRLGEVPKNIWLGVTAENQEMADERIPWLLKIPAAVHFVSVEPMLEPVDLFGYLPQKTERYISTSHNPDAPYIDWVICGGETGPGARSMKPLWAQMLYHQCHAANVPFFFKKPGDGFQGVFEDWPMFREYPKESE